MSKDYVNNFIDALENPFIAGIVSAIILTAIGFINIGWWTFLFTTMLSYFIADFLANAFVRGGEGIAQITIFGNSIQERGHAFLFFIIGIIIGSWISGTYSDIIASTVTNTPNSLIFANLSIILISYVDFYARFYEREN